MRDFHHGRLVRTCERSEAGPASASAVEHDLALRVRYQPVVHVQRRTETPLSRSRGRPEQGATREHTGRM